MKRTFLFIVFLPLISLIFLTSRLWTPIIAEFVGEYDHGMDYKSTYGSPYGSIGTLIERDSNHEIYRNVLFKKQALLGFRSRYNDEGGVRGYFIAFPSLLPIWRNDVLYHTKGLFYYEEAPFVKEWFTHLPNLFWLIFLLFFQGVFIKYFYGKGYQDFLKKRNHS